MAQQKKSSLGKAFEKVKDGIRDVIEDVGNVLFPVPTPQLQPIPVPVRAPSPQRPQSRRQNW